MIRLGYVTGNRMTNVKASNAKLVDRALRILMAETALDEIAAKALLDNAGTDLRVALVMAKTGADVQTSSDALEASDFIVERAISLIK